MQSSNYEQQIESYFDRKRRKLEPSNLHNKVNKSPLILAWVTRTDPAIEIKEKHF